MKNYALVVTGLVILAGGVGHLVRYYTATEVMFGTYSVPLMWSLPIGIVLIVIALWDFVAASK